MARSKFANLMGEKQATYYSTQEEQQHPVRTTASSPAESGGLGGDRNSTMKIHEDTDFRRVIWHKLASVSSP